MVIFKEPMYSIHQRSSILSWDVFKTLDDFIDRDLTNLGNFIVNEFNDVTIFHIRPLEISDILIRADTFELTSV